MQVTLKKHKTRSLPSEAQVKGRKCSFMFVFFFQCDLYKWRGSAVDPSCEKNGACWRRSFRPSCFFSIFFFIMNVYQLAQLSALANHVGFTGTYTTKTGI